MEKRDEQAINSFEALSESETEVQNQIAFEDDALLHSYESTNEFVDAKTRKFAATTENSSINFKTEFEAAPTKFLRGNDRAEQTGENAMQPSILRFVLVCLFFSLLAVDFAGLLYQHFFFDESSLGWKSKVEGQIARVSNLPNENFPLQIGDEIISVNGLSLERQREVANATVYQKPGTSYRIEVKRGDDLREFHLTTTPISLYDHFIGFLEGVLLPLSFWLVGLLVFLLKPNDKIAFLMALMFCGLSIAIGKDELREEMPTFFKGLNLFISIFTSPSVVLFFLFFLVFPKPPRFVQRFPRLTWLLFLPALLFVPGAMYFELGLKEWFPIDENIRDILIPAATLFSIFFYLLGGILLLLLNYFRAIGEARRKLNVIVAGAAAAYAPSLIIIAIEITASIVGIQSPLEGEDWLEIIILLPQILIPISFAYAIVRHKVIPVSLIVRRSLQYVLAKNALRLLLILPILGVIWNVAANPNRILSEILLQNSFGFYVCVFFGAGLLLINRYRLRDWIDRRFFREQYNQEKILRELTETVKESDSLVKLSRLVSSKVQSALHPENVYLFFRDDSMNSDFSLGYTTGGTNGNSMNLKIAADSPLLRFMQQERGAVEFPTFQTDDLPHSEKNWLRETGTSLLVPMHGTDGKLAGIFSLGEKLSHIPYSTRDKELLETLANQIALVHENLNLKDRVRREQRIKNEVLSRFDEAEINLLKECPLCGRCYDRDASKCEDDNSNLTFTLPVERTIENRYRLEKLLGMGGMGAVYETSDTRINRRVALKILSGAMFGKRDALRRFEREAQTAGRLQHKNIVTVFDYGVLSTEGAFLVMELIKGEPLSEVLRRKGKLNSEAVTFWFAQVLDGVEAAHKAGIIHRDLKPDNILVARRSSESESLRLCILDFGLARFNESELAENVTVPGTIMGTLGYMSPEQLRGEKVDERSDLFAVGVMIYECLYGERPFGGRTYQEIMRSIGKEMQFNKDEPFAELFKRSLAQKPENRFASAGEMRESLLKMDS
ncbi:MAG TPA: protein kinase [Pyrinomonadaceae bacterium]